MFELKDPPHSFTAFRAFGRVILGFLIITLSWVIFGLIAKLCALLFFLGWDLV